MKTQRRAIFISVIALIFLSAFLKVERVNKPRPAASEPPAPEILAKAALVKDLVNHEILFKKNEKEILALASLTKIISALVILDAVSPAEEVAVSKEAVESPEPSSLLVGEHFQAKDLLAMAMVESSNDAIAALVFHIIQKNNTNYDWFLGLMRKKAEELGASGMNFYNISGLDVSETASGAYGSAEDMMKITETSLVSPLWGLGDVKEIISREGIKHTLKPTNDLAPELTPLVGSKTGYTDLAGGNLLVIVEYPIGHPIGIVVLGSTEQGRFEDVKKIFEWVKTR